MVPLSLIMLCPPWDLLFLRLKTLFISHIFNLIHPLFFLLLEQQGGSCFKIQILLLFRYAKANRSGDDCHQKGSLSLTVPKRRVHATPCMLTWGRTKFGQETKEWAIIFTVAFVGRNRQVRVRRVRIGELESFQWALGHKGCCQLSGTWPWNLDRWVKEVTRLWDLGWLVCIGKVLTGESFTISRTLGGAVCPGQQGPRSQSIRKYRK